MLSVIAGAVCLGWYVVVAVVSTVGYVQIYLHHRSRPKRGVSELLPRDEVPHVTVIRPVKGLEPNLYECLASTFQQTYPAEKLTIRICISTRDDPAFPILLRLIDDFPNFDAKVLVEDEDPALQSGGAGLGPNPKIRNMSRAYREAKGDLIWIIDCNVWVGKGVAGRMVDLLCGYSHNGPTRKNKFVHQLPLLVDVTNGSVATEQRPLLNSGNHMEEVASTSTAAYSTATAQSRSRLSFSERILKRGGTRLEEQFLSSSHAKFYTGINTILVAPCIVGKSNMFRRSHLDYLTRASTAEQPSRPSGIDYFSHNICEDHLIGDLLWRQRVREEEPGAGGQDAPPEVLGKHALLYGDPVIQPAAHMTVAEYVARRVRWLRVRKFTVTLATLVEPGTESLVCSAYGAYVVTTLPFVRDALGVPSSWAAAVAVWLLNVCLWCAVDWSLYRVLHSMASVEVDANTPEFVRGLARGRRRPFREWVAAWLGREALALPVWLWAVFGGVTVMWRGQSFRVGMDATVRAVRAPSKAAARVDGNVNRKARVD